MRQSQARLEQKKEDIEITTKALELGVRNSTDNEEIFNEEYSEYTEEIDLEDGIFEKNPSLENIESDYDLIVLSDDDEDKDVLSRSNGILDDIKTHAENNFEEDRYDNDIVPRPRATRKRRTHEQSISSQFHPEQNNQSISIVEDLSMLNDFKNIVLTQSAVLSFAVTLIVSCTISLLSIYLIKMLLAK